MILKCLKLSSSNLMAYGLAGSVRTVGDMRIVQAQYSKKI